MTTIKSFFAAIFGKNYRLLKAAKDGKKAKMKRLIDGGANINAKGKGGWTCLHFAARGDLNMVIALVHAGANVNAMACSRNRMRSGYTPLHIAATNGQAAIASFLVAFGADVNAYSSQSLGDGTPLHDAVKGYHTETVIALIKAGADVDAKDNKGNTPLILVLCSLLGLLSRSHAEAYPQIALALIEAGASVNEYAYPELIVMSSAEGYLHLTLLHRAAMNGHAEILLALINAGADVYALAHNNNYEKETPLDMAIRVHGKDSEIARILREAMGQ